jgi:hypothetical protein
VTHELPSFARYLNKVFDFRTATASLTDARLDPEIPPSTVFLAAFHGFVFRLPSFQQLEAELTQPALQRWIGADRAFRDDVLRYSLSSFSVPDLEQMLVQVNRTLKRNKAFYPNRVQGRIVAALDGVEVLSSYSRCCDACQERRVQVRKAGVKVEQVQYYHRAVGCQIVSSPVKAFLAVEWLQPGGGCSPIAPPMSMPPNGAMARPISFGSGIPQDYRSLLMTRVPSASSDPKKRSPRIITAVAKLSPRPPITNGSGLPRWTVKRFRLSWSVNLAMTAGSRKTMAGTI